MFTLYTIVIVKYVIQIIGMAKYLSIISLSSVVNWLYIKLNCKSKLYVSITNGWGHLIIWLAVELKRKLHWYAEQWISIWKLKNT